MYHKYLCPICLSPSSAPMTVSVMTRLTMTGRLCLSCQGFSTPWTNSVALTSDQDTVSVPQYVPLSVTWLVCLFVPRSFDEMWPLTSYTFKPLQFFSKAASTVSTARKSCAALLSSCFLRSIHQSIHCQPLIWGWVVQAEFSAGGTRLPFPWPHQAALTEGSWHTPRPVQRYNLSTWT